MKRVYIDTNTFSQMKSAQEDRFAELKSILENEKDNFFFLFSRAHIDDLQNDKTNHRIDSLNFIESFCGNYFLSYDHIYHKLNLLLATPLQVNDDLKNADSTFDLSNIFSVFDTIDVPELKEKINELKTLFNSPTLKFNVDEEKLRPKDKEHLLKIVPEINSPVSMNDFFAHFQTLFLELNDKKSFKDFRRYNLENLPAFSTIQKTDLNAINEILKASPFQKDLNELIEQNNQTGKESTFNQQISNGFMLLNFFGLDKEKNKKANFVSLTNDSQHSFFAAYCDIMITEDEGLRIKSKILYENYNIPTQVCSVEEFIDYYKNRIPGQKFSLVDFINSLNSQIKLENFSHEFNSTQFNRNTKYYKPAINYFEYFDLMEFIDDVDTGRAIVLVPNRNLSLFYQELKLIVNKIVAVFGTDLLNRGDFSDEEISEIDESKWSGRIWGIEGIAVCLEINSGTGKLSLNIGKVS